MELIAKTKQKQKKICLITKYDVEEIEIVPWPWTPCTIYDN